MRINESKLSWFSGLPENVRERLKALLELIIASSEAQVQSGWDDGPFTMGLMAITSDDQAEDEIEGFTLCAIKMTQLDGQRDVEVVPLCYIPNKDLEPGESIIIGQMLQHLAGTKLGTVFGSAGPEG